MSNQRSLLVEASRWIDDHWPELPNESTVSLRERIDAALVADEPLTPELCDAGCGARACPNCKHIEHHPTCVALREE
jgi:hypothetical protein